MTHLPYSVRQSNRAKYARLSLSPQDGLTVVIPKRFDRSRIPHLLESRSSWIRRAQERLGLDDAALLELHSAPRRPHRLNLAALDEHWHIEYSSLEGEGASSTTVRQRSGGNLLLVCSAGEDEDEVREALKRWLSRRARAELSPWLMQLARERSIEVTGVSIRAQRTRWASCSATGRISLNRNLLFLPPELVSYVLLHELCHRRELSHSTRFWRLLAAEVPEMAEVESLLTTAWRHVPKWVQ